MAILESFVTNLDATSVIVFLLVFMMGYYWITKPKNLPPGPRALPIIGNMLDFKEAELDFPKALKKWKNSYGDLVCLKIGNKNFVIINSYKLMHEAFVKKPDIIGMQRPHNLHTVQTLAEKCGVGVGFSNGNEWKGLRKATLVTMRDMGVGKSSLEERVREEIGFMVDALGNTPDHVIKDVGTHLSRFAGNIICSIIFGKRFKYDDPNFNRMIKLVKKSLDASPFFNPVNFFPVLRFLPAFAKGVTDFVTGFQASNEQVEKFISEAKSSYEKNTVRHFIDLCIKMQDDPSQASLFTAKNMQTTVTDLFLAGIDTSSTILEWLILFMIDKPEVQSSCQQELDKVLPADRLPTMEDRKSLHYIQATITEAHRHASITPLGVAHSCTKDTELGGYSIPANTILTPNLESMHHDPQTWKDPHNFHPERFIDSEGHFVTPKTNYAPFSIGPRSCVGEHLAKIEVFLAFSSLIQTFTFSCPGQGRPDMSKKFGLVSRARLQDIKIEHRLGHTKAMKTVL